MANGLESAHQAQALGVVVHGCGLTLEQARSLAGRTGAAVRVLGQDSDCAGAAVDRPEEMANQVRFSDSGPCPAPLQWNGARVTA